MTDNSFMESGINNVQIQDDSGLNNDQSSSGIIVSIIPDNSFMESGINNVQIQDASGVNNDQNSSGIMVSIMEFYNINKFIIYYVLSLIYLLFVIGILVIIHSKK
jgi:hypothetical protein